LLYLLEAVTRPGLYPRFPVQFGSSIVILDLSSTKHPLKEKQVSA
jgi:hypothetical protein